MMKNPSEIFKEQKFIKIENFIDENLAKFLYEYIKLEAIRCDNLQRIIGKENVDKDIWGSFDDGHIQNAFSRYGDLTFDTLVKVCNDRMNQATGLKLITEYSYHRLYVKGCDMSRHKDRASCEVSVTLCLGYDTSNVEDKNYQWPMWIKSDDGIETPIYLNPGDAIIYRGYDLEHWREEFLGLNHAQVFLHYNDAQGSFNIENDERPALGLPAEYKKEKYIQ
jgi:hypothetical protein